MQQEQTTGLRRRNVPQNLSLAGTNPPTPFTVLQTEPSNNYEPDSIFIAIARYFGYATGIITFTVILYFIFVVGKYLKPGCASPFGRECNGRGECIDSVCYCDRLFSGPSCTETQIAGYDLQTNVECSGHGNAFPFIFTPDECAQTIIDGVRVGPGWLSDGCEQYVFRVRKEIQKVNGDLSLVYKSASIPNCLCYVGYAGESCEKTSCPIDENGNICGGHGNTTVGLVKNGTNDGDGCQCDNFFAFYQEPYVSYFNQLGFTTLFNDYNYFFTQRYCGQVYQFINASDDTIPNIVLAYTLPRDYKCYCDADWSGLVCTEGRCPMNTQTDAICYGNGHPGYGFGKLTNTTLESNNGKRCTLICEDGYALCNNKCYPNDASDGFAALNYGSFCDAKLRCTKDKPIRCASNDCVEYPDSVINTCALGFTYGSFDYSQIDYAIQLFKCPNITSQFYFEQCFLNTTVIQGITQNYTDQGGFHILPGYNITVDLGSPLIYFEMVSNQTGLTVQTWDGQMITFPDDGFVSHFFSYPTNGQWEASSLESGGILTLVNVNTSEYTFGPMGWNYSAFTLYNSSYTKTRASSSLTDIVVVLEATNSHVVNYTYSFAKSSVNGVIIAYNITGQSIEESLWYYPDGTLVLTSTCFSEPSGCSWYVTSDETQVRNLQSTLFICNNTYSIIVQETACDWPFSSYASTMAETFYSWETFLDVTLEVPLTIQILEFDSYELSSSRTQWPFTISWVGDVENLDFITPFPILVENVALLTLDVLTVPCACDQVSSLLNRTQLNNVWWDQITLRTPNIQLIQTGDYVLAADFSLGSRVLKRSIVSSIDLAAETFQVNELTTNYFFDVALKNTRTIDKFEVLAGTPDCDQILTPFFCPGGGCTTASSIIVEDSVNCNCTYAFPISNCNCTDISTNDYWGCQCNGTGEQCMCGFPANHEFERDLLDTLHGLIQEDCTCLLFEASDAELTNTSLLIEDINRPNVTFEFAIEQVPTHVIVKTTGVNCDEALFQVFASSYLFSEVEVEIEYNITNDPEPCEYWLTLYIDQTYAFSSLTVVATDDDINISWSSMLFSIYGFSLFQQDPSPTFTASSNSEDAINVNLLNATYWMPETDIRHYPSWLRVDLSRNYYIDFTTVVFYYGGRDAGNFSIPIHVYLQASQDFGSSWYVLGAWGVYVEEGGWFSVSLVLNSTITYSSYRLIAPDGIFGVRQWGLYTQQECNCPGLYSNLVLNINSTEGIPSISQEMEDIAFLYANLNASEVCIAENNCTLQNQDVTNNGICNDVIGQAFLLKIPPTLTMVSDIVQNISSTIILNSEIVNVNYTVYEYLTNPGDIGFDAVQFAQEESDFLSEEGIRDFFHNNYSEFNSFIANDTNGLWIFFLETSTTNVFFNDTSLLDVYWINGTFSYESKQFENTWSDLVSTGTACAAGFDVNDCGPSNRLLPVLSGFFCVPTPRQVRLLNDITNATTLVTKGYYISNLTELTTYWTATYQNITLTRKVTRLKLDNCPGEVCSFDLPYKCPSGLCALSKRHCNPRYNCPGNGCVQLTDTNSYRCACAPGFGGEACQYGACLPASPEFNIGEEGSIPPSEQCFCGGPPPFRMKPPVLNIGVVFTNQQLELLNTRPTGNSAPASVFDINYHAIMPIHAPFGQVVLRKVNVNGQTIYTTCPCLRQGYYGEYILLTDDVESRTILQRKPTWKTYINPFTGSREQFVWRGICTYDELPYRCPNSQCVPNRGFCEQSLELFPLCNNQGECRADGTCACYSNFRTFSINTVYSETIRYPYASEDGVSLPTVWALNWNWKHHSKDHCAGRNCDLNNCQPPTGCFTGTPLLNFVDAHILCPTSSPSPNLCAPTINECNTRQNLTQPMICSGNGIIRQKDYTNEYYCACGTPISPLLNITGVSQIVQLKPNGYGGPSCSQYFADTSQPLVWSSWDFKSDQPWRSTQTGEILPGKWFKGSVIVGPRPEDRILWEGCCAGYDRLELCPYVPCNMPPNIRCTTPMECLTYKQSAPLLYVCNDHGTALADGRCQCVIDVTNGEGYTYDFSQFSDKGCYKFVKCPISPITNTGCHDLDQCSPAEFRYPLFYDKYFEQQWFTCGLNGKEQYSNATKLAKMSSTINIFEEQRLQAAQNIAERVLAAETALAGCICVYPNDTQSDKCCMVDNDVDYHYEQNFNSPYFLNITIDEYPLFTDGVLEAGLFSGTYVTFTSGDTFTVQLPTNDSTIISAIRVYGYSPSPGVQLSYWNSDFSSAVCLSSTLISEEFEEKVWLTSTPGVSGAHYCGPFYSCVNSRTFPLYSENCDINPDSLSCRNYKQLECESNSENVYWPEDSLDRFEGCSRTADTNGCICCHLDTSNSPVENGIVNVRIDAGSIDIGQFRMYGYTQTALPIPGGLVEYLDSNGPPSSGCQDAKYLIEYLGADRSLYAPQQSEVVFLQDAKSICSYTGGFLAISDNIINPSDVSLLSKQCSIIVGSQNGECWVNAINVNLNDTIIPRSEIFESTLCTTYGCYESYSNQSYAHFFSNSSTLYTSPRITGQVSLVLLANQLQTIYNRYGLPLIAWEVLPSINVVNTCYVVIDIIGQCSYQFVITADPYFAAANSNTYLYGEFIPWKRILKANCGGKIPPGPFSIALKAEKDKSYNYATLKMYDGNEQNCKRLSSNGYSSLFGINTATNTVENSPGPVLQDMLLVRCEDSKCSYVAYPYKDRALDDENKNSFTSYNCLVFFPVGQASIRYAKLNYFIPKTNTGTLYKDLVYGYTNQPYMPLFAKINYVGLQTSNLVTIRTFNKYITQGNNSIISNGTDPYYVKAVPSSFPVTNYVANAPTSFVMKFDLLNVTSPVLPCSQCFKTLYGLYIWDQLYYSESSWQNTFEGPSPELYLEDLSSPTIVVPISSFKVTRTASYVNQINYINSKWVNVNPPFYQWYIPQCVIVTKSGMVATVCTRKKANYICNYDWTKYCIVTGYQCPSCGPSTRTSGAPLPDVSCFEDNPLANATLYPFEHEIKNAYVAGVLDLFVSDFNLDPDIDIDFGNITATFPGFFRSWLKWSEQFSSRPEQTSKNVAPELNWCDMCLECNFPINCGAQIDPRTNLVERYCAFSEEYCNIDVSLPDNTLMKNSSIPPILLKVASELSSTDPTCGANVVIAQYLAADKYGGPQSDLFIYNQILALTQDLIQIQISSEEPKWYNSGKIASENFVFQWNDTVTISGYYYLDPCVLCIDPIMEIIIYPLNLAYTFPDVYLSVNVSMEVGVLAFYQVNFTVTQDDTGVTMVNGEEFPTVVFRNPGYLFHNLEIGSGLVLYNPTLTDSTSREQCETRIPPPWYEPRLRIKSTVPYNKCLITEDDLLLYPGYAQGECACDISLAGKTCDCPAVISKFGKEVCGGFGDNAKSVQTPDGSITTTGSDTEQGCYTWAGVNTDCKTIDIGRALFTLLVPGAVFDYPSVFVEVTPSKGVSIFQILPNNANEYFDDDEVSDACAAKGMYLPFYYTIDELYQLAAVTRGVLPCFMAVDTSTATSETWPWNTDAVSNSYFIRDDAGVFSSAFGSCSGVVCSIVNFNNYAFSGSITSGGSASFLIDGNTLVSFTVPVNTILTWDTESPLEVSVYTFGRTDSVLAIACTFGTTCDDTTISGSIILYTCRCPNRQLTVEDGIDMSEIQIFSSFDTLRSTSYQYS